LEAAVDATGLDHMKTPRFLAGVLLVVLAAISMLTTDGTVATPITLLIVGVILIATSRRSPGRP
jgi:hypothetical protein